MTVIGGLILLGLSASSSLGEVGIKEQGRVLNLTLADLTDEAAALLDMKYPDQDWDVFRFPQYVYKNHSIEVSYMIAAKEPELLRKMPCYCFCDRRGHKNLLYCFLREGKAGGEFDPHASRCDICYGEAIMGFVLSEKGASEEEIHAAVTQKYKLKE